MSDLLVSLAVAAIATVGGWFAAGALDGRARWMRRLAAAACIAVLLCPGLLIGYAYADFTPVIRLAAPWRCGAHALLVTARLLPVTAAIWLVCPNPATASAWHAARMVRRERTASVSSLRMAWGAYGRTACGAAGVAFLVSYMEFELASFLAVERWTVKVFDGQVTGASVGSAWRAAWLPAVAGFCGFAVCVWGLVRPGGARQTGGVRQISPAREVCGVAALVLCAGVICVTPVLVLPGVQGASSLSPLQFGLSRELLSSLAIAALAGSAAWCAAGRLSRTSVTCISCVLPGMHGALLVGLTVLALLQLPVLWRLRETPIPLVAGLLLALLPLACLLTLLVRQRVLGTAAHSARLLARSDCANVRRAGTALDWRYRLRPVLWCAGLLSLQGFSDVTLATLLAPVRMPLVMPRLYNFMHYGRSGNLTAWLLICVAVPLVLFALCSGAIRIWRTLHAVAMDA